MRMTANPEPAADAELRDRAWMAAVARGDRVSFERLYLHHHGRLARFLARHKVQRDVVDEIINETFWTVWRSAGTFRGDSRTSTWIIGIAWRCLLKSLRSRPPAASQAEHDAHESEDGAFADADAGDHEQRELRDWLACGLALLPPEQRATIELAYYFGQSCEEIATIMECPVGTVKARMFHARVRLRNTLPVLGGDFAASPVPVRSRTHE